MLNFLTTSQLFFSVEYNRYKVHAASCWALGLEPCIYCVFYCISIALGTHHCALEIVLFMHVFIMLLKTTTDKLSKNLALRNFLKN